jgi:hypothetical protein
MGTVPYQLTSLTVSHAGPTMAVRAGRALILTDSHATRPLAVRAR